MSRENEPITPELLERYDRPGPRYTSYPTAVEFHDGVGASDYVDHLRLADADRSKPLSIYVHLPFCEERCWYCGCNVVVTRHRDVCERYLDALYAEVDRVADLLPGRRAVSQYHWGGGTPTYLEPPQIEQLHGKITERFSFDMNTESAIEVDPRVTSAAQVKVLHELGFRRISVGVQDFTPEVQEAIHRGQTESETRELVELCRTTGFGSINFDLVYGLPCQTESAFRHNVEQVLVLRPERLALYSYAHLPALRPHQKRIPLESLPAPRTKLALFCLARDMLLDAGYESIGMDHFALPGDELFRARSEGRLHRSFMGYTVAPDGDTLGFGISAIGEVQGCYVQNARKLSDYHRDLDRGELPVERGYRMDLDDRIRRAVILGLMCNGRIEPAQIGRDFEIDFADYFRDEIAALVAPGGPAEDGLVEVGSDRIEVVGLGSLFVRNVAMIFDGHSEASGRRGGTFSRTV